MEDWKDFIVEIGGQKFRPVSMATLTILYDIKSPIVCGGEIDAVDYCIFAWLHAAPIMEILTAIKAGTYSRDAVIWGAEQPPAIFASYTPQTLIALHKDLQKVFVDKNTGFIPFPLPLSQNPSWWQRVFLIGKRLLKIG